MGCTPEALFGLAASAGEANSHGQQMSAPHADSEFVFATVILGAGKSTRMGRPKLLLPWGKRSVIEHLVSQWAAAGAEQITVVCAADDHQLQRELGRVGVPDADRIFNPAPEAGMFSSIRCAALWTRWNPRVSHWVITLGDQPHLHAETLLGLVHFARAHSDRVCQPARAGHPRHPVLMPKAVFLQLGGSPAANLRQFLSSCEVALWESSDPGLDLDLDRPEDYERALAMMQSCHAGGLR